MRTALFTPIVIIMLIASCGKEAKKGPQPWQTADNVEIFVERMQDSTLGFKAELYYKGAKYPFETYWPVTLVDIPPKALRAKVTLERDCDPRGKCFYSEGNPDKCLHGEVLATLWHK